MTLLTPLALALSALSVPIILMYILKLRRRPQVVSSTLLWQRALDDVQANAPWQRLRPSILLLLQLLALLVLVLALAQPAFTRSQRYTGDLIVIVDQSYGMQAHDITPSRFASALSQAHSLASNLPDGNVASVIGMGAQPRLAIAESSDGGAISTAINSLQPGVSAPNFLGALSLAASLARSGQQTRVVVFTSRESGISTLPLQVAFPVEIVRVGGRLHDLGITAFSAVHDVAGKTRALVRIGNYGAGTAGSDLNLYVDGQLVDVRPLSVDPGKQQTIFWTDLPATARVLQARLMRSDDVSTDKSAWAVTSTPGLQRVLLVTKGDYFLQTALSLDPTVQLSTLAPAAYTRSLASRYDLVVFDATLPLSLPATSVLLLSPPAGHVGPLTLGKYLPAAGVNPSAGPSGLLLQFVDLSDVHVGRGRAVSMPGWMLPVASSQSTTLIAAGENKGRRMALATFSLQESDWPLRISFPILIQNLLHYLVPGLGLGATQLSAGQAVQLYPPPATRQIAITRPDGGIDTLFPPFPPYASTEHPGIYTARTIGGFRGTHAPVAFAVNFLPSRPAPAAGPPQVVLGHAASKSSRSVSIPFDLGWAFALAVLALLTAEWWFAFRR